MKLKLILWAIFLMALTVGTVAVSYYFPKAPKIDAYLVAYGLLFTLLINHMVRVSKYI